ncbi:hypothetical protein K501DRAFT_269574 [Backusella circina FSU 941]|nr:hypothetical protein K501DRAFT_269574 [Backusella circina FSU 941]
MIKMREFMIYRKTSNLSSVDLRSAGSNVEFWINNDWIHLALERMKCLGSESAKFQKRTRIDTLMNKSERDELNPVACFTDKVNMIRTLPLLYESRERALSLEDKLWKMEYEKVDGVYVSPLVQTHEYACNAILYFQKLQQPRFFKYDIVLAKGVPVSPASLQRHCERHLLKGHLIHIHNTLYFLMVSAYYFPRYGDLKLFSLNVLKNIPFM